MINTRVKHQAVSWLHKQHQDAHVTEKHPHATTVPPLLQVHKNNDELKDFMYPMLKMTGAHKVKKFGANEKTYAQAIGMENGPTDKKYSKLRRTRKKVERRMILKE